MGTSTPNIMVILAADLGYSDLSYASANIYTPSRAGLMTGRYLHRTLLSARPSA